MKKAITLALVFVLALSLLTACGGKDNTGSTGGNSNGKTPTTSQSKGGDQQLVTEDRTTGIGSMARDQYYAETDREEFTFDKKGTLTDYKTIYTLEKGVTDKQKQEAVDTLTGGNFSASISEHTIVVDGKGNYLGFPYAESKLTESKKRLDEKGTEYNLGSIGKVKVPSGDKKSGGAADINTVAGRLSKAGLKLDAIKPDTFAEASIYGMDKDGIVMYLTNPKGKLGEAMMKPMVMKVIEATAAVADDKKYWAVYYGMGEPKPLDFSQSNWDAWNFIAQWSYQKDGQWITATLGVVPAEEPEGQDKYAWEITLTFNY